MRFRQKLPNLLDSSAHESKGFERGYLAYERESRHGKASIDAFLEGWKAASALWLQENAPGE